jgi:NAD(P)-dependent dehydrogenase (short-subunit alcohol dehydrogenase family)
VRGEGWGGGLFIGGQRGRGWVRAVTAANGGARVVALAYGRARADVWAVLESDVAGLASAAREGGAREERGRAGGLPRGRSSPGVARVSGQELGCPFWAWLRKRGESRWFPGLVGFGCSVVITVGDLVLPDVVTVSFTGSALRVC